MPPPRPAAWRIQVKPSAGLPDCAPAPPETNVKELVNPLVTSNGVTRYDVPDWSFWASVSWSVSVVPSLLVSTNDMAPDVVPRGLSCHWDCTFGSEKLA